MRCLPMLLLIGMPYLTVAATLAAFYHGSAPVWAMGVLSALLLVLVVNMAYAFFLPQLEGRVGRLFFWALVIKTAHLPLYAGLVGMVMLFHIFMLPLLPPLVTVAALMQLASGAYGVSLLLVVRRRSGLTRWQLVTLVLLQGVVLFDIGSLYWVHLKMIRD